MKKRHATTHQVVVAPTPFKVESRFGVATKVSTGLPTKRTAFTPPVHTAILEDGLLNYGGARKHLIQQLQHHGIHHGAVLRAFAQVPRHLFIDEGLHEQAYDVCALPIGWQQTASSPLTIARMLQTVMTQLAQQQGHYQAVLEIGTGSGFQTALLSCLFSRVYSIERIQGLQQQAAKRLQRWQSDYAQHIHLHHGDGLAGWPQPQAQFDAVIACAAMKEPPQHLMQQVTTPGILVLPYEDQHAGASAKNTNPNAKHQRLVAWRHDIQQRWHKTIMDEVYFVPMLQGTA